MKDSDLRAMVLQAFYDKRHTDHWTHPPWSSSTPGAERQVIANICGQLAEHGLILWKEVVSDSRDGHGRITARGVDVIEGNLTPPIAIHVDRSITVEGSSGVQIGDGNVQGITIGELAAAIGNSKATANEKAVAKGLLDTLMENPLVKIILGKITSGGGC
jgi:hypothetical protein